MDRSFILAIIWGTSKLYLDPGSGSMLIQLIIGAVLGLGVFIRIFWKNIKSFFTRGKSSTSEVTDPTAIVESPAEAANEIQPETPTDTTI